MADPDTCYRTLCQEIIWDSRMKARKTASFGVAYNYSQISYPSTTIPSVLIPIIDQLAIALDFKANNCLINYYEDGYARMGFHSDDCTYLAPNTGIAIISLGATRTTTFREKISHTHQISYALPHGSLLYMDQATQQDWQHAILKASEALARMSLTFRLIHTN